MAIKLNRVHSLGATQLRQKRDYDLRLVEQQFDVGDLVYRIDSSTKVGAKALKPVWQGPYLVVGGTFPLYRVRAPRREVVLHHERLKLCLDREIPLWLHRMRRDLLNKEPEPVSENVEDNADDSLLAGLVV